MILLEEVLPVPQAHRAGILRDGIDRVPQEHLAPGIGHKLILYRSSAVGGQIDQPTGRLKGRQELELNLGHVWLIVSLDRRKQLVVFDRACPHIGPVDMNVGMGLVEERDLLPQTGYPAPVGQRHRPTRGTAAPRTGVGATTRCQGDHDDQCYADEGEASRKAAHPVREGNVRHCLSTPL